MYRLKPMLATASRIHSANGGVRASQARSCEAAALTDAICVSGAIPPQNAFTRAEGKPPGKEEVFQNVIFPMLYW